MGRHGSAAVLVFVLAAAVRPEPAQAFCRMTTGNPTPGDEQCFEDGFPLRWIRQCVAYSLVVRGPDQPAFAAVRDAVDRSFATWQAVRCADRSLPLLLRQTEQLVRGSMPEFEPEGRNANVIAFVSDWAEREYDPDAFGLTLVSFEESSGEILDADMMINETRGELAICENACPEGSVDLENVVTHEAGHFLGLSHSELTTACMFARSEPGETRKRVLDPDDVEGLCSLYGELAAASCLPVDFIPRGGFAAVPKPESGGCNVVFSGTYAPLPGLWAALCLLALGRRRARRQGLSGGQARGSQLRWS